MILAIVVVAVIVYIQEGQRRIPIQYASRVRGRRMYQGGATFLPLRVNQAGVIPIIFAVSILLFPVQLASYFATSNVPIVDATIARGHRQLPQTRRPSVHRLLLPADHRLHLLLHGLHVQARRDGRPAAQERRLHPGHPAGLADAGLPLEGRLPHHVRRRPLPGHRGGLAAHLPWPFRASPALGLGGTALLIVVSVVVETMKQIEAQLMMRNYEGFIR